MPAYAKTGSVLIEDSSLELYIKAYLTSLVIMGILFVISVPIYQITMPTFYNNLDAKWRLRFRTHFYLNAHHIIVLLAFVYVIGYGTTSCDKNPITYRTWFEDEVCRSTYNTGFGVIMCFTMA